VADTIAKGRRLKDRYRLERTLGRGGMAAVWLGHDETLDRPVAIKVLSDTIASDPGFQARFRREARILARLSHPNLARVYDFSDEGERPYLVMEMVPGETLASLLERGEPVDCDRLARELLEALSHIHEFGILHRDVKPANIIIEPSGNAKLIDFGIALPLDATSLTSTGLVIGTGRYVAPEVMGGRTATERSDLYSSGLVLGSCRGQCSQQLAALIRSMSSENPHDRPHSAADALERLEGTAVGREATETWHAPTAVHTQRLPLQAAEIARPPSRPPRTPRSSPPPEPERPAPGSRRRIAVALVGLLAVAGVVAFVALGGGASSGDGAHRTAREKAKSEGREHRSTPVPSTAAPLEAGQSEESTSSTEAASETAAPVSEGPSETDSADGASLNEEGFAMIQNGEYEAAVPVLEEAVASFPEGSEDVNYGYALFNLGHALRLSGRPEEAIPILERRLEIPDQEGAVREELEAASAEAG
jgi:serine/threonine protein kinase